MLLLSGNKEVDAQNNNNNSREPRNCHFISKHKHGRDTLFDRKREEKEKKSD
jgi:hypothetical protein